MAPRVYVCDQNPRMRQLIRERLHGHAEIVGEGGTAADAVTGATQQTLDVLVLDYRTAIGSIEATVAAVKEAAPDTAVVIHTGVPRNLIEEQVTQAGAIYSSKSEPEHLPMLVRALMSKREGVRETGPASTEAASPGS
ncbi:MAG TPA: hypothetical protein VD790_09110 [Thermoleophilaceae bacterium]|nr:hypothetical protein [Thermoleophilaceae bacterium]